MDRFLIAPLTGGMQNNIRPWLIPDDAYEQLTNAYIYRGRVRKRFGSKYMVPSTTPDAGYEQYASRLRINIGTLATVMPITVPTGTGAVGQSFTVAGVIFTVTTAGAANLLIAQGSATTATFNTATGQINLVNVLDVNGIAVPLITPIYWYPCLPVMGLLSWERGTINNEPTIAFDTRFAYEYSTTGWERLDLENTPGSGEAEWAGTDSQFFWGTTYQGTTLDENFLYVTNYNENEINYMRYLDESNTWHKFGPIFAYDFVTPAITGQVVSARIIVGFRDHMVLLNTWESLNGGVPIQYGNRIRYCAIGSPIDDVQATAAASRLPWVDDIDNPSFIGGGVIDNLQTQQQIISAEFIKDRLIVYYERETWELVYTGNQQQPFVWQQINTEFGAQSTFSKVPFDTEVLAIAQNGITSCTGANVTRIDGKIPLDVFQIRNDNEGVLRVQGIRDFAVEQVYWTIPSAATAQTFARIYPNQVLVYNYIDRTWAYNYDCFTAFGYYTQQPNMTWGNTTTQWQFMTQPWGSGSLQSNYRQIVGGNQEGFVTIIDPDLSRNAGALQVTNMTYIGGPLGLVELTIINHNLSDSDVYTNEDEYICLENIKGNLADWAQLNYDPFNNGNFGIWPIDSIESVDRIRIQTSLTQAPANAYVGGGTVARVSNLNILSKQWNPYVKSGQNVFIQKMNFLVDRTGGIDGNGVPFGGSVTVEYYPSTSKLGILTNAVPGQLMSNGVLDTKPYPRDYYPLDEYQDRVWRSIYYAVDGNAIQIRIIMRPNQIDDPDSAFAPFVLHAIEMETMPASYRIGG